MAQYPSQLFKLEPVNVTGEESGQREIEWGWSAFSTSNTAVEVRTGLTHIECVIAIPIDPTGTGGAGNDVLYSDGIISSNQITISRGAAEKSGMKFWWLFIGYRYATS
jgi:hypothetical protein